MNHLFFDTETNGLPEDYQAPITLPSCWPHILQFAWVLTDSEGKELERHNDLIQLPEGVRLDDDAATVHGLTTERLAGGIPAIESLRRFAVTLAKTDILVAHNIDFDRSIVQAELYRQKQHECIAAMNRLRSICTMQKATTFCAIPGRRGYKWPRLSQLHQKLFNEGFSGAHDAMTDVEALMRCFWALKERSIIA